MAAPKLENIDPSLGLQPLEVCVEKALTDDQLHVLSQVRACCQNLANLEQGVTSPPEQQDRSAPALSRDLVLTHLRLAVTAAVLYADIDLPYLHQYLAFFEREAEQGRYYNKS